MFRNLSVKLKLYLSIVIGVVITVGVITLFSVNKSKKELNTVIKNSLIAEVNTLSKMFEREHALKLKQVKSDLNIANELFYNLEFQITTDNYTSLIRNQISNSQHESKLNIWKLNNALLHQDFTFVDHLNKLFGATATIFQKSDSGYVRISTNVPNIDGSRALNTFIPNSSPVIKTIEEGKPFYGRAFVVNDWYITAYEPIYSNDEIVGMLYVGSKEKDLEDIRKVLADFKIGKSGYVFAFDENKQMLIHPDLGNPKSEDPQLLSKIIHSKEGVLKHKVEAENHNRIYAFTYFSDFKLYIAASIDERVEISPLINGIIINSLIIGVLMIIIFSIFVYYVTTENIHKFLEQLESSNKQLANTRKELERSENQFREFFNSSSDEIFVIDLKGFIVEVNQVCCDSLGYSYDELIGMHFSKLKTPKYFGQVGTNILISKQQGQHLFESEHITKSGNIIPVEIKSRLIDFNKSEVILTIARNILERKEVEDKILRTIISTEEKERKRFAADLHDDLAPILSTIKLYTDLIKKGDLKNINQSDAIKNIDELVEMSLRTTKEISNNIRPNILQDFGLADAITEFCNYLKETKALNISLTTEKYKIKERGIEESVLYQALKELMNNTIKHAKATKINIDLKSFDNHIILYYRDNGIGFNIKEASTSKSGLGLYNIFNKLKSINGTYDMHSEPDKGMFILISLKLKKQSV